MFIGGVGIAAKIFWDEVSTETSAFDPENRLMFMNGPLAGFPGLAGSRWVVCGKCPTTDPEHFGYSNFGGRWGAQLKLAGYDGIVIYGKSDKRVFLLIKDQTVQIKDAADLWGKGSVQTREILKNRLGEKFAVAACGPAGENMVVFGTILADNDASGSSGLGAVMGSKNLKAVAVMGSGKVVTAYPERLKEVRKYVHKLWKGFRVPGDKRCEAGKQKKDPCYGCFGDCPRAIRILEDGTRHKSLCVPPASFHIIGSIYYGDMNQMPAFEVPLQATILLDDYGLDAFTMLSCLGWIVMCSHAKVLTEETSGLPLSKFGSLEFMETLIKKIALREGFGDILAQGVLKAADSFGEVSKALLMKSWVPVGRDGRAAVYCPRLFPANGMIYATEPSMRIQQLHEMSYLLHRWLFWADENFRKTSTLAGPERFFVSSEVFRKIAKKFWGSELAADFSTYEDKALAAKKIQDRSYAKESLILCDYLFPITSISSGDYVGDPTVESKIFSAVT
jgi:aldehyde:ferredoxin oxidoreductase